MFSQEGFFMSDYTQLLSAAPLAQMISAQPATRMAASLLPAPVTISFVEASSTIF